MFFILLPHYHKHRGSKKRQNHLPNRYFYYIYKSGIMYNGKNRLSRKKKRNLPKKKHTAVRRKKKTTSRLSGEQPDDWRNTPAARFPPYAVSSRRDDRAQGRRQIKATPRDPSSLKLRRDKVYLLDCLSRRNVMKPEGGVRRFDKRLRTRARRTPFAINAPQKRQKKWCVRTGSNRGPSD